MSPQRHEAEGVLVKRGLLIANHSPQAANQTRNPSKLNYLRTNVIYAYVFYYGMLFHCLYLDPSTITACNVNSVDRLTDANTAALPSQRTVTFLVSVQ